MRCCRLLLSVLLPLIFTLPASAGILFGKHSKQNPAERVPQLIVVVKTDQDQDKRANAAKELREFDPAAFPELVPVLIDVLQHDPKASVRAEAAQSLGKLRPISQEAGWALEQATHDSALRVRWQARNSLMSYRIAGYRSPPKAEEITPKPPVANSNGTSWIPFLSQLKRTTGSPSPKTGPVLTGGETPPPPLADPPPAAPKPKAATPTPTLLPTPTPKLQKPPAVPDQGPDLPLGP
jgi:hypothetical protein